VVGYPAARRYAAVKIALQARIISRPEGAAIALEIRVAAEDPIAAIYAQ
jgi:hypothetical protein